MKNQEIKSSISLVNSQQSFQKQFECPINMSLMQNPTMITVCGHTFEKEAIERYFLGKKQCPICRQKATDQNLRCNYSLKNIINTYTESIKPNNKQEKYAGIYDIKKAIDKYYDQTQIKIKQANKNNPNQPLNNINTPKIPGLNHKINKQMSDDEIYQIAQQAFKMYKIQIDKNTFQIIRQAKFLQLLQDNYLIQWSFDNIRFQFGQCKLNSNNQHQINGYGFHMFQGQVILKGQYLNGKVNGKVQFCHANGSTYQGDWRNDRPNGKGKTSNATGTYTGDYTDGEQDGKGKCCYADGSTYQGDWKNGEKHGKGKYMYPIGEYYLGDFKHDQKDGKGKYCWADGTTYQGDWNNGRKQGKGKYSSSDGSTYQGDWHYGKQHGIGKLCYNDGSTYLGQFKQGKPNGKGKIIYSDGSTYQGQVKEGKQHGKGKYYFSDGGIFQLDWTNEKIVKRYYYSDGSIYQEYSKA